MYRLLNLYFVNCTLYFSSLFLRYIISTRSYNSEMAFSRIVVFLQMKSFEHIN